MFGLETGFISSLGWALVNSLWQMAFLWVIYQLVTYIFPARAGLKSSLTTLFLFTGFAWFIYTILNGHSNAINRELISFSFVLNNSGQSLLSNDLQQIIPYISVLYLLLLIFPAFRFVRNYRYVQVIQKYGLSKIDVEWRMFTRKIAERIGINKRVNIWVSEFVSSPVTIGFLKPIILIPLAAINNLSTQQLEAVLLHELSHIKRSDFLINLFINIIQTFLYFNPFVKAFVKIVERERENSCDELVLQFQYDSHEYANALLTLEKNIEEQPLFLLAATGKENKLLHRIEKIVGIKNKKEISFQKIAGIVTALFCIIAVNLLLLVLKPINNIQENSFAHLSSPLSFFAGDTYYASPEPRIETTAQKIINNINNNVAEVSKKNTGQPVKDLAVDDLSKFEDKEIQATIDANLSDKIQQAALETVEIPALKKYQEAQVKEALESSRKILENTQWKMVEKNIADAFTEEEKEELRSAYHNEVSKFNWEKWGNKLKMSYDKVDWDQVNSQLNNAVTQIRVDSLQKVFTNVLIKLNDVKKELQRTKLPGIPDTDITLKELERKKLEAQKTLQTLKAIRNKKIVHL